MRDLRMLVFQVRQFVRTSYFTQVLIISTVTAILLQLLLISSLGEVGNAKHLLWLRAGFIGSWSVSCVAAGILGFQRYQETLPLLVFSQVGAARAIFPVVISCVAYGMLAFPLAAIVTWLFQIPVHFGVLPQTLLGLAMHFCGSAVISMCIALFFLFTPNAITYEPLLSLPVLLLIGVFGYPPVLSSVLQIIAPIVPLATPFAVLQNSLLSPNGPQLSLLELFLWCLCLLLWLGLLWALFKIVLKKVIVSGTLELV